VKTSVLWLALSLLVVCAYGADFHLVISEVYSHTVMSEEGAQFVELYNPLTYDVDISGWRVDIYDSEAEDGYSSILLDGVCIIPTYGFFLIGISDVTSNWPSDWVMPDVTTYDIYMESLDCGVRLVDGEGETIDAVGWGAVGDNDFYEEVSQVNPPMGNSIERKSGEIHDEEHGNSYDTDNNYNDTYIRQEPEPQNTDSPAEDPSAHVQDYSIGILKAFYGSF